MRVVDAIAEILKREGVEFLNCYPSTPLIEACAKVGIRPIVCRQERVGVGIADGYARVRNGRSPSVFAMQHGPGAENAFPGISTAFSDSTPVLFMPMGHPLRRAGVFPLFNSVRSYETVTKFAEQINFPERVVDTMRRAFAALRSGRPGPVLVEIPGDMARAEIDGTLLDGYCPVKAVRSQGDPEAVEAASRALMEAERPILFAGSGVLYAEATGELAELAELLQIPVMTTMEGKSAISEKRHPLALGIGSNVMTGPSYHFLKDADLVFAVGSSLTNHGLVTPLPGGKTLIHATNDPVDIQKTYAVDHPILGDAKLILQQFIDCCRDRLGGKARSGREGVATEIAKKKEAWLGEWKPKLTSADRPINPYRVVWELMQASDAAETVVTHDSGNPRYEVMPFYQTDGPRTYLGWGKSHQLGTGLGLAMGAKLASPEKFCVNFMGDAAFGMTGLDFETSVRAGLPICTVILKNSTMAVETPHMKESHEKYRTRDVGGEYAEIARSLGGWSERIEDPAGIGDAFRRAQEKNREGKSALLEFITCEEMGYSHFNPFG